DENFNSHLYSLVVQFSKINSFFGPAQKRRKNNISHQQAELQAVNLAMTPATFGRGRLCSVTT
ncbi:hypothetical protein, partial [Paenibacillus macerans]|uniref:hypothetical protein n=1 Tax=Paenibacillus macerans TaxID=44252 RepID=UPI003D2D27B3